MSRFWIRDTNSLISLYGDTYFNDLDIAKLALLREVKKNPLSQDHLAVYDWEWNKVFDVPTKPRKPRKKPSKVKLFIVGWLEDKLET